MTKQEFVDKWGYQSGFSKGFDCREQLLKDLDKLLKEEKFNNYHIKSGADCIEPDTGRLQQHD